MEKITSWQPLKEIDKEELETLCTPLVEFLQKKCNPHTWLIIQWDGVALAQDRAWLPFKLPD